MSDRPSGNTWTDDTNKKGAFARRPSVFRNPIAAGTPFEGASGRYHLYVSLACPWAHRTLIVRALKGLEAHISVDVVDHFLTGKGWSLKALDPAATADTVNGTEWLRDVYLKANPEYAGRVTVPVLWDRTHGTIVNNESSEIIRFLNTEFQDLAERPQLDLYPQALRSEIDAINAWIYPLLNNGVYKAGFAKAQEAHDEAERGVFEALDRMEALLSKRRWLTGDTFTEADVRAFTTLLRFDPVYHIHFKCSLRRLVDYPNLWAYTREIAQHPLIKPTINLFHIKEHYFRSHESVNPVRLLPLGPALDWDAPHDRDAVGGQSLAAWAANVGG